MNKKFDLLKQFYVAALKFLILPKLLHRCLKNLVFPKYFLVAARKIMILFQFLRLGSNFSLPDLRVVAKAFFGLCLKIKSKNQWKQKPNNLHKHTIKNMLRVL